MERIRFHNEIDKLDLQEEVIRNYYEQVQKVIDRVSNNDLDIHLYSEIYKKNGLQSAIPADESLMLVIFLLSWVYLVFYLRSFLQSVLILFLYLLSLNAARVVTHAFFRITYQAQLSSMNLFTSLMLVVNMTCVLSDVTRQAQRNTDFE